MERNVTLDFVRGVAILGILLLNISAFGLPKAAYLNPAWYGAIVPEDAWSWAILDIVAQAKFLTLFALLFGAGLQMLLPRGKQWIQSRLTLLVLLGFIHALFFWDGDILLAYGLVGLICWRLVRDAPSVKSLFNTGILLYLVGIGVLLLLGVVSSSETSRAWTPDASAILYEKYWKLNGQYSLRHYRRTGALLVALGLMINLPAVILQWWLDWAYRWCAFLLQAPRELSAPLQTLGYAALMFGFWPQLSRCRLTLAIACVGRMALTNYLLQTIICTTLFYQFGLFMKFNRLELLFFVVPVWAINLLFSVIWLRFWRQGPVEWLWRQLTLRASGALR
ncbi:DUF418 family protein [Salmonella enterica subsp. enterica]|nr:DUF418 family protein [Salmonella enterica subsp. enterica serovar Veneziana]